MYRGGVWPYFADGGNRKVQRIEADGPNFHEYLLSYFQVDGIGSPLMCSGGFGLTGLASQMKVLKSNKSSRRKIVYMFTDIFQYNVWIESSVFATSTSPFPNKNMVFLTAILVMYFNN